MKHTAKCQNVTELHACFHREAGGVLDLALGGEKEQARKWVDHGGSFGTASAQLTQAMLDWRKDFAESSPVEITDFAR